MNFKKANIQGSSASFPEFSLELRTFRSSARFERAQQLFVKSSAVPIVYYVDKELAFDLCSGVIIKPRFERLISKKFRDEWTHRDSTYGEATPS